jgi:opacity protein-like surface antigen
VSFGETDSLTGDGPDAGWIAGGGAEYLLSDFATAGAEYLHSDFGGDSVDVETDVVRARLNLKLGGLGLPW